MNPTENKSWDDPPYVPGDPSIYYSENKAVVGMRAFFQD